MRRRIAILLPFTWFGCGSPAGEAAPPVTGEAGRSEASEAGGAVVSDAGATPSYADATVDAGSSDSGSPTDAGAGADALDGIEPATGGLRAEGGAPFDGGGPAPANPHASANVRRVLAFLKSIEGKAVVTGQLGWWHEGWCNNPDPSLWPFVVQQTGHTPALYAGEIWTSDLASEPAKLIAMWNAQTLVTLQWHAPNPAVPGSTAWTGNGNPGLTAVQWTEILTPGTPLNTTWTAAIDAVAAVLKQLRDAGVVVIWRPLHESHGGWFWWGTNNRPAGAIASLYQMMFVRFTNVHGLDNLIWNWNSGGTDLASMYPGANYVDIISVDAYGGPLSQDQYKAMLPFGKLVAWGEWGLDDSQTYVTPTWILANEPKVVYVMQWYGACTSGMASPASYKPFFTDPNGIDSPVRLP